MEVRMENTPPPPLSILVPVGRQGGHKCRIWGEFLFWSGKIHEPCHMMTSNEMLCMQNWPGVPWLNCLESPEHRGKINMSGRVSYVTFREDCDTHAYINSLLTGRNNPSNSSVHTGGKRRCRFNTKKKNGYEIIPSFPILTRLCCCEIIALAFSLSPSLLYSTRGITLPVDLHCVGICWWLP